MTDPAAPPILESFAPLAPCYDLLLCDIWGVIHNGMRAHPAACLALTAYRRQGGTVVLVSNAPRPNDEVARQLAQFGVPADAYDAIVTSGDVTVRMMAARGSEPLYHIGPPRDLPMFDAAGVRHVALAHAAYVVCTGLFDDETETPDDYAGTLGIMRAAGLPMICANPDLVVERGHKIIYCAGAVADAYATLGGEVAYAGKPHRPIYEIAIDKAAEIRGAPVARSRIVAIGDAIRTDVTGARGIGVDVVFVSAGIHAADIHSDEGKIDPARLEAFLAKSALRPDYVIRHLAW